MAQRTCSVEGCDRPHLAKGLCGQCYRAKWERERRASQRPPRPCETCGVIFQPADRRAVYCSKLCKHRSKNTGTQPNTGSCLSCGASLAGKRVDAKYCDGTCFQFRRHRDRLADINKFKRCVGCEGPMPLDRNRSSLYCSKACKIASRRHEAYGLTRVELDMLLAQHDACAICGTSEWGGPHRRPNVDHDHVTGKVRGLLCAHCNQGLGRFKDDPARLRAAASYLEAHAS